jgi:UDP:flavonoid glycosyltransferase YjiC (YdhE family)
MSSKLMGNVHPVDSASSEENVIKEFVLPLKTQPEIIPCPKEFDFDHYKHSDNVTYVEPMISTPPTTPEEGTQPPEIPAGKKVIFATSGSMVEDYLDKAKAFFQTLIDMMYTSGMTDWHLVLAVGPQLYNEFSDITKTNVSIYDWVSQIEVLEMASVVFVHGGLATIKEAIYKDVPLIVVPHGKDQMDNALRVRKGNVGLIADINKITPDSLKAMMTDAISNSWILENLGKMSEIFDDAEKMSPRPSVSIIESAL